MHLTKKHYEGNWKSEGGQTFIMDNANFEEPGHHPNYSFNQAVKYSNLKTSREKVGLKVLITGLISLCKWFRQ